MNLVRWLTRKERARQEEQDRRFEAGIDRQLFEIHMHNLSEDMGFRGDPSWYCEGEEVGNGHYHLLPSLWRADASYMKDEPSGMDGGKAT